METNATIEQLVKEFADNIIKRDQAAGAPAKNKFARKSHAAFVSLVNNFGDDGREGLKELLDHEDVSVQVVAAAYLLRHCTEEAMAVLTRLASGSGLVALGAQCSIDNWNNDRWELDLASKQ